MPHKESKNITTKKSSIINTDSCSDNLNHSNGNRFAEENIQNKENGCKPDSSVKVGSHILNYDQFEQQEHFEEVNIKQVISQQTAEQLLSNYDNMSLKD